MFLHFANFFSLPRHLNILLPSHFCVKPDAVLASQSFCPNPELNFTKKVPFRLGAVGHRRNFLSDPTFWLCLFPSALRLGLHSSAHYPSFGLSPPLVPPSSLLLLGSFPQLNPSEISHHLNIIDASVQAVTGDNTIERSLSKLAICAFGSASRNTFSWRLDEHLSFSLDSQLLPSRLRFSASRQRRTYLFWRSPIA